MDKNYILPLAAMRGITVMPGCTVSFDVFRDFSKNAFNAVAENNGELVLAAQVDMYEENPGFDGLYKVATKSRIKQMTRLSNGQLRVVCEGICRVELCELLTTEPYYTAVCAEVEQLEPTDELRNDAMIRTIHEAFEQYAKTANTIGREDFLKNIGKVDTIGALCDLLAGVSGLDYTVKQEILELCDVYERGMRLTSALVNETEVLKIQRELMSETHKRIEEGQREFFLREQKRVIDEELGDDFESEVEQYRTAVNECGAPDDVREKLMKEVSRFEKMSSMSPDAATLRNYLDTALEVPWVKADEEVLDTARAAKILDADHYGLEKVKERIIEQLAVRKLTGGAEGTIICLAGPPGTGKTSIVKSIASALGRKYVRVSLGGVHDEAEIRGHRRTYIGSMPGRIMDAMILAGTRNPVILLDEIDKMAADFKGDPTAALLEALDREQNKSFKDHYLDLDYDLSHVMFIATANDVNSIPKPLYDRLEIIEVSGYTNNEKLRIAKEHLLPKQLKENGLDAEQVKVSDDALRAVCESYTREAGVRQTERTIASLMRKAAKKIAADGKRSVKITEKNISDYLGRPKYRFDMMNKEDQVGIVRGLAWTSVGGDTLSVEVNVMPGTGKLQLTGKLGEVMQESAKTAISYIRSVSDELEIESDFYKTKDIHIHIPEGAVPKDGPSAGVTLATAAASALTGRRVRRDIAMTGEITLRGRVLAIGGLKEKSIAALRAGITTVIIPEENLAELDEIPAEVRGRINFIPVKHMTEILPIAFADGRRGRAR